MGHQRINVTPAPQNKIGSNNTGSAVRTHQRLTVGNMDATLDSLCTGGACPTYRTNTTTGVSKVIAVELQVEAADSAVLTYVTTDGGAASATLGLQVPIGPSAPMRIDIDGGNLGTAVHLISTGTAHVQARFHFED